MAWTLDARISVHLGPAGAIGEGDAALVEGSAGPPQGRAEWFQPGPHQAACACCGGRSPAAVALDRLFQRRARGETAFFRRVVAVTMTPAGAEAVRAALRDDPVASARYRLGPDATGTS